MGSSSSKKPTRVPTNYYTGTIMDPSAILPLRASFQEYEDLGAKHRDITTQIENLQERMKESRKSGAFKVLQDQMAKVKNLVKEREDIDAKMAVIDLARKKQDDFNLARKVETSYSEKIQSVEKQISDLEKAFENFSETLDFARCQRPDGSFYGTRGKCEKGVEAGVKERAQKPIRPTGSSDIPKRDPSEKVMALKEGFEKAKADLKAAKEALKAHRGRDKRSRAGRQALEHKVYEAEMKFGKMRNDLVSAVIKAKA
jgi:hypothetical protein